MSEDSKQVGLDEAVRKETNGQEEDVSLTRIRQIGIDVPERWRNVSLGEIGELDTSGVNKKSTSDEKSIQLVNYMDVYENYEIDSSIEYMEVTAPESQIERSQVCTGDILFTPSSEEPRDIGNSSVVTEYMEDTLHSYHTVRLRPTSDEIQLDTSFSGWLANAPYVSKQFARRATGSTRYTLTLGDFSDSRVLVSPIEEQRKIATVLSTVDQAIQKTEEIIEQTAKVKAGLYQDIFRNWSDSTDFDPLAGEYPTNWELKEFANMVNITDAEHFTPDYTDSGIPVLRPGDLEPGRISLEDVEKRVDEETYDELTNRHTPTNEDIVYSRSQNFAIASQVIENRDYCLGQDMVVIEPKNLNTKFLLHLLNSPVVKNQAIRRSTGSTFSRVNLGDIQSFKIPIPDEEVQQQIAAAMVGIEDQLITEKECLVQFERLKQGLMQDLLSGAVRTHETDIEVPEAVLAQG